MPARRNLLGFDCPKCGRNYGSVRKKTIKQNREKILQKDMQIPRLTKDEYGKSVRKSGFNRNLHTFKYDTFFGDFDTDRKPVINLSLPDPSDESYAIKMKKMESVAVGLFLLAIILPFVSAKYPNLDAKIGLLKPFLKAIEEYWTPIFDNRYDRSMVEWEKIIAHSKAYGYHATSRKFYAIKNGKRKYLTPNYIKQKAKVIDKFHRILGNKKAKMYLEYLTEICKTVRNDNELQRMLKKLVRKYFYKVDEILNSSENYTYSYYYIRHYDSSLYMKQKSDLKKGLIKQKNKVIGKIECGPFKVPTTYEPSNLVSGITKDLLHFMRKRGIYKSQISYESS